MRIWHKDLLKYLPQQQLQGQWKELYAIVGEMEKKGVLTRERGYLLVTPLNKIAAGDLILYIKAVHELGISTDKKCLQLIKRVSQLNWPGKCPMSDWHTKDYLRQCFYNLQEKFMCGGFSEGEYNKLVAGYVLNGGEL